MAATSVVFSPAQWRAWYPAFSDVSDSQASLFFAKACLFCKNETGIVTSLSVLEQLLYMLTSHIAALNLSTSTSDRTGITGRLASATQGTVSASYAVTERPGSEAWYSLTVYGQEYWAATAALRRFRIVGKQGVTVDSIVNNWQYPYVISL